MKLIGRVTMRPSSSGSATCMARSRGPRPCGLSSQSGRLSSEQIACNTGTSRRNGRNSGASGLDWAKPVVLTISAASLRSSQSSTCARQALSLRLASAIGNGLSPCAARRSQKRAMKAVLAACRWVR
ncbi:Uncharacterised protein [Acinetobacter baumannii]|nr:Uncharacterised protein [Acinetobacter baumannii]